jgi:hypothetical protein
MISRRVRENVGLAVAWAFATGLLASHPNAANAPSDLSPAFAALLTGDLKFSQNDFAELARGRS